MAPLEIRHRSVRPISAKHAQASRFLQQSQLRSRDAFSRTLIMSCGLELSSARVGPRSPPSASTFEILLQVMRHYYGFDLGRDRPFADRELATCIHFCSWSLSSRGAARPFTSANVDTTDERRPHEVLHRAIDDR